MACVCTEQASKPPSAETSLLADRIRADLGMDSDADDDLDELEGAELLVEGKGQAEVMTLLALDDLEPWQRLNPGHWTRLFSFYNMSLSGK